MYFNENKIYYAHKPDNVKQEIWYLPKDYWGN